jgi:predicted metal-binding membrane protein
VTLLCLPQSVSAGTLPPRAPGRRTLAAAGSATVMLAAVAWILALRRMTGMDMGPATGLGSLSSFVTLWVPMMASMMLPGAVPAVWRHARAVAGLGAVPAFLALYLAVWALVGMAVYAVYRPHGYVVAGAATMGAGLYELTPLKAHFRRRCGETARSGLQFGLVCVGSSMGLMVMLVGLGVMNVTRMTVVAVLVLVQKALPARTVLDVGVSVAIVVLGAFVVAAPSAIPGLVASI